MTRKALLRVGLILVGIALVSSLVGIAYGLYFPAKEIGTVTALNYHHRGEFNYRGYRAIESQQPNPVLFPTIIEDMSILLATSGFGDEKPAIRVILQNEAGSWQKEIPVRVTEGAVLSFPLNPQDIFELGRTIDEQLALRSSDYLLKVIAESGAGGESFVATLEGELRPSTLEWKEGGFNKVARGAPGGDEWRQISFGYEARLGDNDLYGPIILTRDPELLQTAAIDPGIPLSTELVESLDIDFHYQFDADVEVNASEVTTEAWLVMEAPEYGEKTFVLLEPTEKPTEFDLDFALDIDKLSEIAADLDQEMGTRERERELNLFVRTHVIAETDAGTIDEVFEHALTGTVGERIEFAAGGQEGGELNDLTSTKEGEITEEIVEHNPLPPRIKRFSLIGLGASLPILCVLAFLYWQERERPSFLEEALKRNRIKYGELISEVSDDFPPRREGETFVEVSSIEDLVAISDNSLRPILLKVEPDKHVYWVTDGLTRYYFAVRGIILPESMNSHPKPLSLRAKLLSLLGLGIFFVWGLFGRKGKREQ